MSHGKEAARDVRYGRRGGRWASSPADDDAIEEWRRQRDALARIQAEREAERDRQGMLDSDGDPTEGV